MIRNSLYILFIQLIGLQLFAELAPSLYVREAADISRRLGLSCRPLAPGSSVTVNEGSDRSPTMVPRKYRVTRNSENPNSYTIDLNLDFMSSTQIAQYHRRQADRGLQRAESEYRMGSMMASEDTQDLKSVFAERLRAKAQECIEENPDSLRGPNGEVFNFRINDPSSKGRVPQNQIFISDSTHRSNRVVWSSAISCNTIIHELLHLVGLCDTYRETEGVPVESSVRSSLNLPQVRTFDCRSLDSLQGSENVMTSRRLIGKPVELFEAIRCICSSENCYQSDSRLEKIDTGTELSCPQGYRLNVRHADIDESMLARAMRSNPRRFVLIARPLPPNEPVPNLNADQVKLITQPFCNADNLQIRCAPNAYRTSTVEGCLSIPGCQSEANP